MPLYDYQCKKCGHRFERIQKFSDPEVRECPQCGGEVERLVSAPAVQFKGSGWYVTDYARKSSGGAASSSSDKSGDKSGSSSASGESSKKPADSSSTKGEKKS